MKSIFYCLIFILIASTAIAQDKLVLNLTQAQSYAELHTASITNAQSEIQIQQSKADETRAKNLPKVTASADARNNFQLATLLFPLPSGAGGNGELTPVQTGTRYNFTAGVEVSQNILDYGLKGEREVNAAQVRSAEAQKAISVQNLKLAVAKAYYAILLNQEKLKLATDDKLRKVTLHQDAIEKLRNKQGLASDTLRTGLNVRNAILLENQAKDAVKLSLSYLGQQIGASETTEIVVNERLQTRKNPAIPNLSNDSATYRSQPAFLAEETQIALANAQRKKLNYQYLPTVNAYGYYAGQAFRKEPDFYSTTGNWYPVGYWGIKASWTIFDGFQKKAQDRQQLLAIGKSEATKTSLKQSIAYDRLNALTSLRNATRNMDYQTNNIEVANKLYDLARQKVREGQGLQQDVTEAEYTLKQTQQLYLQSVYDYLVADLEYLKATGRL